MKVALAEERGTPWDMIEGQISAQYSMICPDTDAA
jgi:hypothetical protein